jgi:hypothetical protein
MRATAVAVAVSASVSAAASASVRAVGMLIAAAAAVTSAGCTVGSGAGSVVGPMFLLDCNGESSTPNVGTPAAPTCLNLAPKFFAGEPIEDPSDVPRANSLTIRLQSSGNRIEITDTLAFNIQSSFEVARCLRGAFKDGLPDWDTRQVTTVKGQCTGVPWCDWSARDGASPGTCVASTAGPPIDQGVALLPGTPTGAPAPAGCVAHMRTGPAQPLRPLIHFGPQEYVRASIVPLFTCTDDRLNVVAIVASAVEGWIDFLDFGGATSATTLTKDFKVNFGEQLQANFHLVLQDNHVLDQIRVDGLIPAPRIGGTLDGYFDFNLDRGRAAQPFP